MQVSKVSLLVVATAATALLCSLCIYTDVVIRLRLPVATTSENVFRFLSNPMVIRETHSNVVGIKIRSQRPVVGPDGDFFDLDITSTIPYLGDHTFNNQVRTNRESLTISSVGYPLWSIIISNVTWTVTEVGTQSCYIEERTVISVPWVLSFSMHAEQQRVHEELLRKTRRTIERLGTTPGVRPGTVKLSRNI